MSNKSYHTTPAHYKTNGFTRVMHNPEAWAGKTLPADLDWTAFHMQYDFCDNCHKFHKFDDLHNPIYPTNDYAWWLQDQIGTEEAEGYCADCYAEFEAKAERIDRDWHRKMVNGGDIPTVTPISAISYHTSQDCRNCYRSIAGNAYRISITPQIVTITNETTGTTRSFTGIAAARYFWRELVAAGEVIRSHNWIGCWTLRLLAALKPVTPTPTATMMRGEYFPTATPLAVARMAFQHKYGTAPTMHKLIADRLWVGGAVAA